MRAVRKLQLEITLDSIKRGLVVAKLKIQEGVSHPLSRVKQADKQAITTNEKTSRVRIYIDEPTLKDLDKTDGTYERLKNLKRAIANVQVKGLPQVDRGVITKDEKDSSINRLLVTGYGLSEVMGTDGTSFTPFEITS